MFDKMDVQILEQITESVSSGVGAADPQRVAIALDRLSDEVLSAMTERTGDPLWSHVAVIDYGLALGAWAIDSLRSGDREKVTVAELCLASLQDLRASGHVVRGESAQTWLTRAEELDADLGRAYGRLESSVAVVGEAEAMVQSVKGMSAASFRIAAELAAV